MISLPTPATTWQTGSYVPDLVRSWLPTDPPYRNVEGSLVSADISGFTALSERLAGFGREGAEALTGLLNECFGGMIEIIDARGGDVLKFGGDALLVLFTGAEHATRAAAACVRMRRLIERTWSTALVKRVKLGISQGIHSGTFHLHLVEAGHRELLVVGPGMSATVRCEGAAERGQILLSHEAAAQLDEKVLGESTANGRVLTDEPKVTAWKPNPSRGTASIDAFVPGWLVEQTAAGRVAEHRVVTVGFVFFGGVDALLAEQGAEVVHERLQALATATDRAVSRHGIYWLASDVYAGGGKIILAAGAPRSTGQDEEAAVRAAREILDADVGLPLRGGLNRGPVFMGDLGSDRRCTFTVMGDTVNLAARLMQKSGTGQLVASQAVLDLVPTAFDLEPLEPFLVKGKTAPINASLVGAQLDDAHTGESQGPTGGDLPFVGRATELAMLEAALAAVRSGRGQLLDMVGEPGIGKSRLVVQLLQQHPDLVVLRANGGLYARGTPYFAVSTMLRRHAGIERSASAAVAGAAMSTWVLHVAPDLAQWMPLIAIAFDAEVPMTPVVERIAPANRGTKLREVILDLLTTVFQQPTVIVVDDAHHLDEASEELFTAIARRVARRPWLLIAMRRAGDTSFADEGEGASLIHVGPLTSDDTRALALAAVAAGLGGDEDQIPELLDRGITNPLFLLEMVRAGVGGHTATPDSIEALVTARIDTLGAADRLLLREAAVLGSFIDLDLLAEATGEQRLRSPERWVSLSGFLSRDPDGRLRFQQGLYREVAYEGLSYRRRRQLHGEVGEVLERRAGDDATEFSELLSLHFYSARMWDRSWRYSVIAGDRARGKYANAEAAQFYRRALDVPSTHSPGDDAIAEVAEALGDVLELNGRFADADQALSTARRHRRDLEATVRLLRKAGVIRERQGKYTQALRWYGRGLQTVAALNDAAARNSADGELALAYAGVRFRQGRLRECIQWAHRAEAHARQLDDPKMLAHSSYLLMIGYGVLRMPESAHYRDVPLPLFEQLGDLMGQANVLNNLGVDSKDEGRWAEALDFYERSRVARHQVGDVIGAATATLNSGEILSDQGHLDQAGSMLDDALRAFRRAGYPVGVAVTTSYKGRLEARKGDYDSGRRLLAEAAELFASMGATHFVVETKVFQLECEVLAGNVAAAVPAADVLFDLVAGVGDPLLEVMLLRSKAWAQHLGGDHEGAEETVDRCIVLGELIGSTFEVALGLILRGLVNAATGRDRTADHARARELMSQLGVVALPRLAGS